MRNIAVRPMWRGLLLCALVCGLPRVAQSQLTFEWGSARKDTLYPTIEDCLGLVTKVEGRTAERIDSAHIDYKALPARFTPVQNSISPLVVTTARTCIQNIPVTQWTTRDMSDIPGVMNVVKLLIKAQRDTEALAFLDEKLSKLPASEEVVKTLVRSHLASQVVFDEYPTRFAVVRKLADDIEFPRFWKDKIRVYSLMMDRAKSLRDTAEYERAVAWFLAVPKLLGDSLMQQEEVKKSISIQLTEAISYTNRAMILAKLRESVDSFLVATEALYKDAGISVVTQNREIAKPIIAEYWFPEKPATARPMVPGKIGVVIPITDNLCNPCYYANGMWGRLKKKFPEIEFTGFARTRGHFGPFFGAMPPEQEARLIDSFHRKVYGFPGTIAVHKTEFWRVDETYDRRQVEEPGPNEDQYPFFGIGAGRVSVISWDGKFIEPQGFTMDPEENWELFFEALFRHKPK